MSYAGFEGSRDAGNPVALLLFIYGTEPDAYYAYTTAEQRVTVNTGDGPIAYNPIPVSPEAVVSQGTLDKSTLEIDLPDDAEVPLLFAIYPPSQEVSVVIRQGHVEDPDQDFPVVWSGRIVSVSFDQGMAKLSCEPIQTTIRRSGLRAFYTIGCRHALYGPRCRAQMAPRTYARSIVALTNASVTLDGGWIPDGLTAQTFVGGMVRWQGPAGPEYRTILKTIGTDNATLVLAGYVRDLEVGGTIQVIAGCDHTMGDCQNVHANIQNFGGFPWIPLENPVGTNPYV